VLIDPSSPRDIDGFPEGENWMPSQIFANNTIVFGRAECMSERKSGVAVRKRFFRRQY